MKKKRFIVIGQRIRELREEKGWSQEYLASRLGIFQSHLANLETGSLRPTNIMYFALSDLFCVPITDIYADIDITEIKGREFLKE